MDEDAIAAQVVDAAIAVHRVEPIHVAQVISYLRLASLKLGLLLNFNVPVMKRGIKRIANNL